MRHTVEIADLASNTMLISVSVDTIGNGGSWRAIDKGFLRYNSGALEQFKDPIIGWCVRLLANGNRGLGLDSFLSWGTVNDQGTGMVSQTWVIALKPGRLDWSIV